MSKFIVEMSNGLDIEVGDDKKSGYEDIETYGLQAVRERASKKAAYKKAIKEGERVEAIVTPEGERITEL